MIVKAVYKKQLQLRKQKRPSHFYLPSMNLKFKTRLHLSSSFKANQTSNSSTKEEHYAWLWYW